MRVLRRGALALGLLTASVGCSEPLTPGEYGLLRYAGQVRGATPLNLLPPIADRDGNVYVLYGNRKDLLETQLFVGHAEGGWSGGCRITQGNAFGLHGFIGRSENRAYYWSGEALVRSDGPTGGCKQLLRTDPASSAKLNFRAVIPWVRETPSATTTVAWIQSLTDRVPFQVVIDLDEGIYTSLSEFSPASAEEVAVIGTGGNQMATEGVIVVRYLLDGTLRTEARFVDHLGQTIDKVNLPALDDLGEFGLKGFVERNDAGLYVALDDNGQLLMFDRSGGQRVTPTGIDPVGVHRWEGGLWLVGVAGGRPAVVQIEDSGSLGKVQTWDASLEASSSLGKKADVIDDRSLPSAQIEWSNPRTAMGPFPFVHSHSMHKYATDTTAWLIAGPSFTSFGGEERTSIAFGAVGVSYP